MVSKNGWLNDWQDKEDEKSNGFGSVSIVSPSPDLSKFTVLELKTQLQNLRLELSKRGCTIPF
jgi:hypothetical protein